ncbi:hypothetical protein IQ265_03995 [Nodosilinea sp. LEGE 06152]|uniref:hypothetical protein n=1 Tax=Nodosilinea sp. LEGE 06152 TaxID=2777966 RepID=UPI00187E69FB|nr:hypothetical protein [Nodosilinea sp. LEGE 06152]MBE9155997.1 hypothetical protein [Nodosilinea sp. LEGE 06152]
MTDRDRSGLAFSSDGDSSSQNGHHPVQSDQALESNGSDTGDARFVEARLDSEFRDKVRNLKAPRLAEQGREALLQHLWVRSSELHGRASTREIRERSDLTGAFGTGANLINLILTQPFFVALSGPIVGTAISVGVYWLSNLSQKIAVRTADERRPWGNRGYLGFVLLSILQTGLSPWGTALLLFRSDLNNQLAERVVVEFVNSDVQFEVEAANEKKELASDKQEECDDLLKEYNQKKNAGDLAYDRPYILALGKYMANEPADRWDGKPIASLPACPAARRLELEANAQMEQAQELVSRRNAEMRTTYGDSYVTYLKVERPDLFEAYFNNSLLGTRIRSGVTELAEAQALVVSGKSGPTLVMIVFTLLSAITSYTALTLTYHHSKDPLVRQSWSALALSRQHQVVTGQKENSLSRSDRHE